METSAFQSFKLAVVDVVGLSKDALHIHVGLLVFFLAALVFRRSIRSLVPVTVVLALALAGEALDARDDVASLGHWRIGASVHDILNTMFWPCMLSALARCSIIRKS